MENHHRSTFKASLKANQKGILLMMASALLVSIGQYCWKVAHVDGFMYLMAGYVLYGVSSLIMIVAYKYGKLSILQPVLCTSYVFTLGLSWLLLAEPLSPTRLVGIGLVFLGVLVLSGGDQ